MMPNRNEELQNFVELLDKVREFGAETDAETKPAILRNVFDYYKGIGASWATASATYAIVRSRLFYAMRRSTRRALGHLGVKKSSDAITDDIRSALLEPHKRILAFFGDKNIWLQLKKNTNAKPAGDANPMQVLTQRVDELTKRVDKLTKRVDKLTKRVDKLTRVFIRECKERRKDRKALKKLIDELRAGRVPSTYDDKSLNPASTSSGALSAAINVGLPTTYMQPVANTSADVAYDMILQGEFLE